MTEHRVDVDVASLEAARASLMTFAEQLTQHAAAVAVAPAELGGSWTGSAATAVAAEMTALARQCERFAPCFTEAAAAVGTFIVAAQEAQEAVTALNRQREQAVADSAATIARAEKVHRATVAELGTGVGIDASAHGALGQADSTLDRTSGQAADTLRWTLKAIDASHQEAVTTLRAAAGTLGSALTAATVVPVPDQTVRACLDGGPTESVVRALRLEAAARLGDDLPLVGQRHEQGLDLFTSRAQADAEAARLIGVFDAGIDDGRLSAANLTLLERYQTNPWFAAAMMNRMGPAGVAGLPARIANAVTSYHQWHPMDTAQDAERFDRFRVDGKRLVTAIAGTLSTASHDPQLADGFAEHVVEEAVSTHGAAFGLSVLLHRGGRFDAGFATTVAEGIYHAERTADISPFWRPMAELGDGTSYRLFTDEPGSDGWFDPMTGVAQMLARDPATAQTFLLGSDEADGEENRLRYLTADRAWDTCDDGTAFGHLIEAATTRLRDHGEPPGTSPGYRSAQIASQFLHDLPYGNGRGWGADSYQIYDGLTPAVGTVLAAYINDVQRGLTGRGEGSGVFQVDDPHLPGAQSYGIMLDGSRTYQLLEAVMGDTDAFRSVTAAQHTLAQQQLAYTADQLHDPPPGMDREEARSAWMQAITNNSQLWGSTMSAANAADIDGAVADDARVTALQDLAGAATGAIPVPGGKAVELLFSTASGTIFGGDYTDYEGQARVEANRTQLAGEITMEDLVAATAAAHHLFDTDAALEASAPNVPPDSPGYFLRPDGTLIPWTQMTELQQQEYQVWLGSGPLQDEQTRISSNIDNAIEGP
ncbi:MAG: DUF6571 family protein [Angustibacter sp.]